MVKSMGTKICLLLFFKFFSVFYYSKTIGYQHYYFYFKNRLFLFCLCLILKSLTIPLNIYFFDIQTKFKTNFKTSFIRLRSINLIKKTVIINHFIFFLSFSLISSDRKE